EMDERELWDHVNREAGLYLPFAREDADIDFQKLGTFIDEDGLERLNVLLVATPREVTDSYIETFQQAGLTLSVLEVSSFSLLRTIRDQLLQFAPQEVVAIADIEFDSTEISIVMDGIPQFTRRVPIGTSHLQTAVSRAINLPVSMGADLLQGMVVPLSPTGSAGGGAANPSSAAILRVLGELADELRRSIDFYLNQGEDMEVAQLLLAGPGAGIERLDEFFTQRLGLTTIQIDPIDALSVEISEEISSVQRPGLGVVMGLGLRGD
ncbi:MAG TPA: type IV pilus assembly protein PilM, partial [Candidatus Caenarcaniphilales bacterium]